MGFWMFIDVIGMEVIAIAFILFMIVDTGRIASCKSAETIILLISGGQILIKNYLPKQCR
jgi:hypothetical protein